MCFCEEVSLILSCLDPALWSVGGAIGQARYMSRWPALQIKLKLLGTEIPVYRETPPRHNSDKFCKCGLIKL